MSEEGCHDGVATRWSVPRFLSGPRGRHHGFSYGGPVGDSAREAKTLDGGVMTGHLYMLETYGYGPGGVTCESCASLQLTAKRPTPTPRLNGPLTTFTCRGVQYRLREPWSLLNAACGKFEEA